LIILLLIQKIIVSRKVPKEEKVFDLVNRPVGDRIFDASVDKLGEVYTGLLKYIHQSEEDREDREVDAWSERTDDLLKSLEKGEVGKEGTFGKIIYERGKEGGKNYSGKVEDKKVEEVVGEKVGGVGREVWDKLNKDKNKMPVPSLDDIKVDIITDDKN